MEGIKNILEGILDLDLAKSIIRRQRRRGIQITELEEQTILGEMFPKFYIGKGDEKRNSMVKKSNDEISLALDKGNFAEAYRLTNRLGEDVNRLTRRAEVLERWAETNPKKYLELAQVYERLSEQKPGPYLMLAQEAREAIERNYQRRNNNFVRL